MTDNNSSNSSNSSNSKSQRPQRRDFQIHVVLAPNGQIVDPQDWQKAIGDAQGKDRRQILRENGWKETTTFNQQEYEKAVGAFRTQSKTASSNQRQDLFKKVYEEAAVEPHPRLDAALRTLMPSIDDSNERKMIKALVGVCVAVDGMMKPAVQRGRGRKVKDASPDASKEVSGGQPDRRNSNGAEARA
jgi:hypothetical protein